MLAAALRTLRVKHAARKLLSCVPKRSSKSRTGVDFDFTYASIVNGSATVFILLEDVI